MGTLRRFDIAKILKNFHCKVFVETGTGGADGVAFAASFEFEQVYSIEIHPQVADAARARLAGTPRTQIITATSEDAFRAILPTVPAQTPILFWLDAHFPGADSKLASYKDEPDENIRLPLERELTLIREMRPDSQDCILIDDLRIYEDGPFQCGNMPDFAQTLDPAHRNIDFVARLFGETHRIQRDFADEGYLIVLPDILRGKKPAA
jgi:hypothetical protein